MFCFRDKKIIVSEKPKVAQTSRRVRFENAFLAPCTITDEIFYSPLCLSMSPFSRKKVIVPNKTSGVWKSSNDSRRRKNTVSFSLWWRRSSIYYSKPIVQKLESWPLAFFINTCSIHFARRYFCKTFFFYRKSYFALLMYKNNHILSLLHSFSHVLTHVFLFVSIKISFFLQSY